MPFKVTIHTPNPPLTQYLQTFERDLTAGYYDALLLWLTDEWALDGVTVEIRGFGVSQTKICVKGVRLWGWEGGDTQRSRLAGSFLRCLDRRLNVLWGQLVTAYVAWRLR